MTSGEQNKLFILIDGHSLAFRAYYAFAKSCSGRSVLLLAFPPVFVLGF
jgi:DNA polymerase-1